MTLSDGVLDRLSMSRPGYELLDVDEAALPVFAIRADVLLIDQRPLGPLEEFVLKAIDAGFLTVSEVAGVLGLEQQLVIDTLVELQRQDCVDQVVVAGNFRELRLTSHGARVLESELRESPSKEEVRIFFNRLTWTVDPRVAGYLMKPKDVAASELWELPLWNKRKPRPEDLRLGPLQEAIRRSRAASKGISVLVVDRISRTERLYLPVHVGVFKAIDGPDTQVAVLIDERPSTPDEEAIERHGGLAFIGGALSESAQGPMHALVADYGADEAADLAQRAPSAEEREESRRLRLESLDLSTPRQEDQAVQALTTSAVEFIDTFEHREYLNRALDSTKQRLVIISPWITAQVVNAGFRDRLSKLLRQGVRVHIGYGLEQRPGDRRVSDADTAAERALWQLAERFDNFVLAKLGNTHSKQLLFDDVHISGSFNWLSFQGARSKTYRHEESTIVRIKSKVDAKYLDLCRRIDDAVESRSL